MSSTAADMGYGSVGSKVDYFEVAHKIMSSNNPIVLLLREAD